MQNQLIALLPMKHTSERVPGKNYRSFAGKPLFHHILETLISCDCIHTIIINTDSDTIASDPLSRSAKVKLVQRPEALLGGDVPTNAIIEHDMSLVDGEHFLQTHSTNPLLTQKTILEAADRYFASLSEHDSSFSVTRLQTRLWDQHARPVNHDPSILLRTQDLPPIYEENSCMYFFSRESFGKEKNRLGKTPAMFEMDAREASDIDDEIDFQIAEALMLQQMKEEKG